MIVIILTTNITIVSILLLLILQLLLLLLLLLLLIIIITLILLWGLGAPAGRAPRGCRRLRAPSGGQFVRPLPPVFDIRVRRSKNPLLFSIFGAEDWFEDRHGPRVFEGIEGTYFI